MSLNFYKNSFMRYDCLLKRMIFSCMWNIFNLILINMFG